MASLTATPNPAPPSTVVAIAGTGFAYMRTRLLLDGSGSTTNVFRPRKDGTFNVGITVASTARTQVLVAQQLSGSTWTEKARLSIVVQAVVVTPPPPPVEPPPPPPPPPPTDLPPPPTGWDTKTLQQLIDVMSANGVLNLNGRAFTDTAIVAKDGLTIVNGSITKPGATLLVVKADGVVVRDVSTHDCYQAFQLDSTVDSFELDGGTHLRWVYYVVHGYSARSVKVHDAEIGFGSGEGTSHNAYGVGASHSTGTPPPSDWEVTDNYVHDSVWHGLDTHGGIRIAFRRNKVRNCRRGIAVTVQNPGVDYSQDCIVEDNDIDVLAGYTNPYFSDRRGVWVYQAQNVIVRRNAVGAGIETPFQNVGGSSTVKDFTGNTWKGQPVTTWA